MPSFNRNKKVRIEKCGTQPIRPIFARHKTRCSARSLTCSSCTNFSTKFRAGMNCHIAKKDSKATPGVAQRSKICDEDYHSSYRLRENKQKEHGSGRGSGPQNDDFAHVMGDVGENSLKEELEAFKHFLVDSEMKNGRHRVYDFAMDTLDAKHLLETLNVVFDSLKCAAKLNVVFGFVLKNVADKGCRYYYAHEKNTLLEESRLLASTEDLTKVKSLPSNTDNIESCTKN